MDRIKRFVALLLFASLLLAACAQQATPTPAPTPDRAALQARILNLQGAIGAHDPVLIKADGVYYRFATGPGIPIGCSPDLIKWRDCGRVFSRLPISAYKAVPGVGDLWAPDISYVNGKYRLYYSASTFDSNTSAIALATNVTLDATRKDYVWVDEGIVVDSKPSYSYNAIDPNYVAAADGTAWLAFGSFWSGIKLLQLDPATGKALPDARLISLARRSDAPGAIEAAFITQKDGYYYLFVSFDQCCKGVSSTYNMRVGRSKTITGPYLDRAGKDMLNGGGTSILKGNATFRGPGHNAVLIDDGRYLLAYHAYDVKSNGTPLLHIEELWWDDGWPQAPSALLAER